VDLLLPKNVGTKTLAWDTNNWVLSPYTRTQLFRARFPSLTAQQAWAGFFQVHKNWFLAVNTVGPVYKPLAGQQLLYSVLEGGPLCPWCKSDCVFATYSLFIAVASFFTSTLCHQQFQKFKNYIPCLHEDTFVQIHKIAKNLP
jgi:hypothetical protein